MKSDTANADFFGKENIWRVLLKIAPPVMLAQLIQALYNIVDSFFVGRYSMYGLTALSVIYPIQLIIIALAVGTGIGVNTYMARMYALNKKNNADKTAGMGILLGVIMWFIFSVISIFILKGYISISAKSPEAVKYAADYGMIVCVGSIGLFLESIWSKVHQAHGDMKTPMLAQIAGAAVNIILDPILIFGLGPIPELGIRGAAAATVAGQCTAAVITGIKGIRKPPEPKFYTAYMKKIYKLGYPSVIMQVLFTVYIVVLNVVLAGFCDEAVTVLGLYYKMQTFFFIPLMALQTCIVPVLSYNYACSEYKRVNDILKNSIIISVVFMIVGIVFFEFFPDVLILCFSKNDRVLEIGVTAFRIIGVSFIPAVFSLTAPVFFQAIGKPVQSVALSLARQIFCLIPLFILFSRIGLDFSWIAFPLSEVIVGIAGIILYYRDFYKSKILIDL